MIFIQDAKMERKGGENNYLKIHKPAKKSIHSSPSSSDSSHISEENDGDEKTLSLEPQCSISPTKDDLKRQIAILEADKAKHKNTQEGIFLLLKK